MVKLLGGRTSTDCLTVVFKNGILQKTIPKLNTGESYYDARYLILDKKKYDLENESDLNSIPIPKFSEENLMNGYGVTGVLDYFLRMKAGNLKAKNMKNLSIACLKKATEIMKYSPICWSQKDYMRIVNWLIQDGCFEKAEKIKSEIDNLLSVKTNKKIFEKTLQLCNNFDTDLIEMSYHCSCCSECAKYRGRVFSITGKDTRFPILPQQIIWTGEVHEGCRCSFHPFIYGVSSPSQCNSSNIIKYSNRPFVDDRTDEEKKNYLNYIDKIKNENQVEIDRLEYYKILYLMPELAPKSFTAYRKIKKTNTDNFNIIKNKCLDYGIEIH